MKVGFIGLGRLGLPCALAIALKGHSVMGYDIDESLMSKEPRSFLEEGLVPDGPDMNWLLSESSLSFGSLKETVDHSDILFVAVQTPHLPQYEGVTRIPETRADFDYAYLVKAVRSIVEVVEKSTSLVIVSTVLPGTMEREVFPVLSENDLVEFQYNPFFIAMGTAVRDFLNPEFVLIGARGDQEGQKLTSFYETITDAPVCVISVESAELAKVIYNTFVGMKIGFANIVMEMCQRLPNCDVEQVMGMIKLSTQRLISPTYLNGGMGDGGGCHPRDNIALSWLSNKLDLSFDWFDSVMKAREKQTEWLADLMCSYDLPKTILGYAFKADTNITTGSAALLLNNILGEREIHVVLYDPLVNPHRGSFLGDFPQVFLIGARHSCFHDFKFPPGSVVIDPWRYLDIKDSDVRYVPLGIGEEKC